VSSIRSRRPAALITGGSRGIGHQAALRQLGNRPVGILHGCLKTNTVYDEATAWAYLQSAS
jgi:NAD(P)-dependent dehydrogenase (short-subunit alcohol dehydrogenase family)